MKIKSSFLNLSVQLAKTGFKLRNEGSYLGVFWYMLNPLLLFIVTLFLFSKNLGSNIPHYPLYLLLGIIMFNLFQQTTTESTKLFVKDYREIIKSIRFPKESLVLGTSLKFLFSHIFEILLFLIVMSFFKVSFLGFIFYPLVLLLFLLFTYSLSLLLSCLTVYFVDLENIWVFFMRLVWLGTPIFYSVERSSNLFFINLLNPIYYFIHISREIVIYSRIPETWVILTAILISLSLFLFSFILFNRYKNKIAESV
jgi:ABC-type polysaccharide/polyol phosphate export permease